MLQAGARLGDRYHLREPIARGGMGEVWRADDTVLGRPVAVKVLLPQLSGDPDFAERFRVEARAMAALSDPNIVEVYDYGQADGQAYLVMQFVPGESLYALLRRTGPLPPSQTMSLVSQAARALHQAHGNGIVHRDVKPGNLLIRPDGRLVLTDFGIARMVAVDRVTAAGEILGTASYLAPEQVTGGPIGPATDVYALGVVAYECLTGRTPFVADTPFGVALMHTRDAPPPLPAALPEPVRHVVARAMAKDPRQRWSSAGAMAQAALAAAGASAGFPAPPPGPRAAVGPAGGPPPTSARFGPPSQPGRPPEPSSRLTAGPPRRTGSSRRTEAPPRRRRLVLVGAAVVVLLALVAWAALSRSPGGANEAGSPTPPVATSTVDQVVPGPAVTTGVAPSPTAAPTTTHAAVAPVVTTPKPTPSRTPGPNERVVPDVNMRFSLEADYAIRAAGLNPVLVVVVQPDKCWVIDENPPANSIVPVGSDVTVTIAKKNPTCEPI